MEDVVQQMVNIFEKLPQPWYPMVEGRSEPRDEAATSPPEAVNEIGMRRKSAMDTEVTKRSAMDRVGGETYKRRKWDQLRNPPQRLGQDEFIALEQVLSQMLQYDPEKRTSTQEVLIEPWLSIAGYDANLSGPWLERYARTNLGDYARLYLIFPVGLS